MNELKGKIAVIYGAGGAIGGAVARAFAREGAKLFLTGHRLAPVEAVARDIVSAGGDAEAAQIDALDEQAIDKHLESVMASADRIDISFNAMGILPTPDLEASLVDMDLKQFWTPIMSYITSYFLTARLAARRMLANKSGVIMTVTAPPPRIGTPNGGYGPSQAVKEALTRYLSVELSPQGIRVVGLQAHAMPETKTITEIYEGRAGMMGLTWEQFTGYLAGTNHPKRFLTLAELANVAVFVASDKASAMMGTTVNVTMGAMD
ncbi:SDR family NAD(P)-dependent oxidoreductase [Dinghuibacter silviterrae]|uniref:Enoyl-[acyl-carrier-protein] reductase [NADH] n=1 Tax=Dinghuibacter silviterrae TaxID=1539049 RepID=A0A4R8DMX7_9BACT|nr:SDR family oxidoreductase [Dinghuibacter silviterrae]TDW99037.1 enoyl-[acyl-carrier-protein] reductase [NADH] [Dinghuibacter silviterrae]